MKIAVTSQNFKTITNHAGKARRFIILNVNEDGSFEELTRLDLPQEMAFHNFQGNEHPLDGVDALLSASFGMGFMNKMARRGITASLVNSTDIKTAIEEFLKNGQIVPEFACHNHGDADHVCGCSH